MNPEDLASQSVRLKEEQLRREEEKLREIEVKVQREINEKRQELLARESQLKEIEARMHREQSAHLEATNGGGANAEEEMEKCNLRFFDGRTCRGQRLA